MNKFFLITCAIISLNVSAQSDVPAPAPKQVKGIYLTHATIHTGNAKVLNNATIGFDNGKIIVLDENLSFKTDETMGKVIDCTGKHIYPGIIATNTKVGLDEIEAVRATNDYAEVGNYNPDARAIIAYNTDSRVTPTVRSNGILFAQATPLYGTVSGTSAVVQLDAWNWEDAAYKTDNGIHFNMPVLLNQAVQPGRGSAEQVDAVKQGLDKIEEVRTFFREAKAYNNESTHSKINLKFIHSK